MTPAMKPWNPVPWLREMQAALDPNADCRPGMAADEIERLRHLFDLRTRQHAASNRRWVEAAEKALKEGKTEELRQRIDMVTNTSALTLSEQEG
jgi:hypothetical protein